jgi:hypothetical protein
VLLEPGERAFWWRVEAAHSSAHCTGINGALASSPARAVVRSCVNRHKSVSASAELCKDTLQILVLAAHSMRCVYTGEHNTIEDARLEEALCLEGRNLRVQTAVLGYVDGLVGIILGGKWFQSGPNFIRARGAGCMQCLSLSQTGNCVRDLFDLVTSVPA